MEERKLSRRAFLGTAGAATGLAALASLGGCAPKTGGAEQAATESVASNGAMQTTDPSKAV